MFEFKFYLLSSVLCSLLVLGQGDVTLPETVITDVKSTTTEETTVRDVSVSKTIISSTDSDASKKHNTTTSTTTTTSTITTTTSTTTTTTTTTTTPTPTTPPTPTLNPGPLSSPEQGTWFYDDTGNNVTCIVVQFAGQLDVTYSKNIGNGLGFRTMPDSANVESTLIYYKANDKGSVFKWAKVIDDFLEDYRKKGSDSGEATGAENRVHCTPNTGPLAERQVCDVPVEEFHPCTSANQYNYGKAGPCVFLKLNKILNWQPSPYNNTEDLPDKMPKDLKHHIKMVSGKPEANKVWVSCEGVNPADVKNIGPVQYIPRRGFPAYYYPFTNQEGYLSPLVAVLFEKPRTGVLINIECKAWAKNIFYDRYERCGSVHFELMVDRS